MANHKDQKILLGNELVTVKRGQRITSIRQLCERWGWSNTKVIQFLKMLQSDGMITYKSDKKKTVITIVNYDIYQDRNDSKTTEKRHETDTDSSANNDETPDEDTKKATGKTIDTPGVEQDGTAENRHENDGEQTQKHTNKNDKNEKNDKKDDWMIEEGDLTENTIREIENRFIQRRGRGMLLTAADIQSIHSLLNDRIPLDVILNGIDFAFDNYKKKHSRDGIKTFAYCETVIRDLYERRKTHAKREGSRPNSVYEGNPEENKPVTRGRVGWLNPRRKKELRV